MKKWGGGLRESIGTFVEHPTTSISHILKGGIKDSMTATTEGAAIMMNNDIEIQRRRTKECKNE